MKCRCCGLVDFAVHGFKHFCLFCSECYEDNNVFLLAEIKEGRDLIA